MPLTAERKAGFVLHTVAEVAEAAQVSQKTISNWMHLTPPMPSREVGKRRGYPKREFPLDEIFAWYINLGPGKRAWRQLDTPDRVAALSEEDLLLAAADTPAMERLRTAKAKLAELDLAERLKQLVPLEEVLNDFADLALHLRGVGEKLAIQCGPLAQQLLNYGLDEFLLKLARRLPANSSSLLVPLDRSSQVPDGAPDQSVGGGGDHCADGPPSSGTVPPCVPSSQPDLVCGIRQELLVADGSDGSDPERQDVHGVCNPDPVPPV